MSRSSAPRAFILADGAPLHLARPLRTLRALAQLGVHAEPCADLPSLADALRTSPGPAWILRAGAWPIAFVPPPASATGKPLLGLGALWRPDTDLLAGGWDALLASTGGDLARRPEHLARLDAALDSVWTEAPAALGALLDALPGADKPPLGAPPGTGNPLLDAVRALARSGHRAVRIPALDVRNDPRLRVVQAITALHRGGAEQIAVDLTLGLTAADDAVRLLVMDRPARAALSPPPGTLLLGAHAPQRTARASALAQLALHLGADVVHAHLFDGSTLQPLLATSLPLVVTLHNEQPGWPAGLTDLPADAPVTWAACSLTVRDDAARARLPGSLRTVWNGITVASPASPASPGDTSAPRTSAHRLATRQALGISPCAQVLLSIANYRPQKRLPELPAVIAALVARGMDAHLLLVGEHERGPAAATAHALRSAAAAHGVEARLHEVGPRDDVTPYRAAADLLITASAHEGLSLAQLEALAAGLPVLTTAVGGAREIAHKHPAMRVLPRGADANALAEAAHALLTTGAALPAPSASSAPSASPPLADDFTTRRMVDRYRDLYRRALAPAAHPEGSLVLVTNNFSTGGAQSSARRLLLGLAAAGVRVRPVVIEEQAAYPTPGRAALEQAGISVLVAPRAGAHDPLHTARAVAAHVDAEPTAAVVFWNVIPEHKILIADLLHRTPVFDVSPGEMYFASLERYFRRPRPALPYLDARDYGALLAGVVVKYAGESRRAEDALGAPVHVIPNGIPVPPAPPSRTARPAPRDRLIVGTLARIGPDKKLEQLLAAAAHAAPRMPPWELWIAGEPERGADACAADLRARSEGLPVRWLGEKPSAAFLADLDLFALVAEPAGCPNASLEAMASGLAVIATDVGGVSEQIVHGETGLLVPRGDALALGDALVMLARDDTTRARMGAAGHQRAATQFDVSTMVERYARLCLGRPPQTR
ncbi:glycosyltransferase [Chondromyces apiculatus]|uniref:Glycosyltransferase subfamily 4-like N-terminal domain-containing protein n=1 Tax=Chondromyces apiculatus DSM 436 TaxID=1192034 RepID=A0A017TAH2_9BACT|nr:glycosyltransferase [Chondromyces apiculatus]EYF05830.1 Hypothetical protein CAP_2831 [Chondromyces apiculatus DSM 436]